MTTLKIIEEKPLLNIQPTKTCDKNVNMNDNQYSLPIFGVKKNTPIRRELNPRPIHNSTNLIEKALAEVSKIYLIRKKENITNNMILILLTKKEQMILVILDLLSKRRMHPVYRTKLMTRPFEKAVQFLMI